MLFGMSHWDGHVCRSPFSHRKHPDRIDGVSGLHGKTFEETEGVHLHIKDTVNLGMTKNSIKSRSDTSGNLGGNPKEKRGSHSSNGPRDGYLGGLTSGS